MAQSRRFRPSRAVAGFETLCLSFRDRLAVMFGWVSPELDLFPQTTFLVVEAENLAKAGSLAKKTLLLLAGQRNWKTGYFCLNFHQIAQYLAPRFPDALAKNYEWDKPL